MRVPSKDYGRQYAALWSELGPAIERALHGDEPILGAATSSFETEFADFVGSRFAVGVGSGTDALILSLRALGVGAGDEVITAANTFMATVTAIATVGAHPVLVEPDPTSLCLDMARVEGAISSRTRAVIPVHLYGRLCDMQALHEICAERDIDVVEDAAQAHGARIGGQCAGAFGRLGAFSFHPSKNLGCFGDGGAITTNDCTLAEDLRQLRNLGKRGKHKFLHIAPNSKLDTIQAVILRCKLPYLDAWNARRREIARLYHEGLSELSAIELPELPRDEEHVFHLFAIHVDRREELCDHLSRQGIRGGLHYPIPPHLQQASRSLPYRPGDFPITERCAERELSLPISPELDDDQIAAVIDAIRVWCTSSSASSVTA